MKMGVFEEHKLDNFPVKYLEYSDSRNPHSVPIGLWAKWWVDNFEGNFTEEVKIRDSRCDLLLQDDDYKWIGLVEVENSPKEYIDKLVWLKKVEKKRKYFKP